MNILTVNKEFNTKEKCYEYLEKLRWGNASVCPYCGSTNTVKSEQFRHHCYNCRKTFSVIVGTMFEDTRLELPTWFMIIALMTNAKQGISAKDIERNTGVTYKTAWYASMRVRCAMIDHCNIELDDIIEMDEAYIGGKPRKANTKTPDNKPVLSEIETVKRGRGTKKTPVVGIVERKGKIVLKVIEKLTFKNLFAMLQNYVDTENATLITDEYKGYSQMDNYIDHLVIEHKKQYVKGIVHTNTIEGFWSLLKASIKGNQKVISKKYLPFYLVGSQYMFNHRNYRGEIFHKFMKDALNIDKSDYMEHYQPVKSTKKLSYVKCKK